MPLDSNYIAKTVSSSLMTDMTLLVNLHKKLDCIYYKNFTFKVFDLQKTTFFLLQPKKKMLMLQLVYKVALFFYCLLYFIQYSVHFFTLKIMLKYSMHTIHGRQLILVKLFLKNKNILLAKNHCEMQVLTILVCTLYSIKYGTFFVETY